MTVYLQTTTKLNIDIIMNATLLLLKTSDNLLFIFFNKMNFALIAHIR